MISQIQEIVDKHIKVEDKLDLLRQLKQQFELEYELAKDAVVNDYSYCPECHDWYKSKYFESFSENVSHLECIIADAGYGDADTYVKITRKNTYIECPKGHRILQSSDVIQ